MSLWIKICGNTSLEDAQLAADAGADAVGFVFAPSPRQVTLDQVATITEKLPSSIEKIGVFVDSNFEEIEATVRAGGLTGTQLHFNGSADLAVRLRKRFGGGLRILRVVHYSAELSQQAVLPSGDNCVDAILMDSRTATAVGGTGIRFDWNAAQLLFAGTGVRMVVAGGLTPTNVGEAIGKLRPWGVDVVSGVESAPGRKDPGKVRAFVKNARSSGGTPHTL